jgi:glucosamine-6-phosphate deaminase
VAKTIEGPVTSMITASALQLHPDVTAYIDRAAAGKLSMVEYYEWIRAKSIGAPKQ